MKPLWLPDPAATDALGQALARVLAVDERGTLIALEGELGSGKTTLARALIRELGHRGSVVSPTYTLVEPYTLGERRLYHIDLYRLTEAEELEDLGLREVDWARDWTLVEWYERGAGFLPPPDLRFAFRYLGCGREVLVAGGSGRGQELAAELWPRLDRMVF